MPAGTMPLYLLPVLAVLVLLLVAGRARVRWILRHDPDPHPDWRIATFDTARDAFLAGVAFLLVGPLLGYLQVFALLLMSEDLRNPFHPAAHIGMAIFGYLFGGIPALLTGVLAGILKPWLGNWKAQLWMVPTGIIVTGLAWITPVLHEPDPNGWGSLFALGIAAVLGGLPAFLCTRLWLRFTRPG